MKTCTGFDSPFGMSRRASLASFAGGLGSLALGSLPTDSSRASLFLLGGVALRHGWATGWVARSLLPFTPPARLSSLAVYPALALVLSEPLL